MSCIYLKQERSIHHYADFSSNKIIYSQAEYHAWGKGSEMYILDEVELLLSSKQL